MSACALVSSLLGVQEHHEGNSRRGRCNECSSKVLNASKYASAPDASARGGHVGVAWYVVCTEIEAWKVF